MEKKGKYMPVWGRYAQMLQELTAQQAGELVQAMTAYFFDGIEPEALSAELKGYWYFLRQDLQHAQDSYEQKVLSGQKGGKRSAQLRCEEAEVKESQAHSSTCKQNQQRTRTESGTESRTESKTESDTDTGSAPAQGARVCLEKQSFGEFGWVKLTAEQYGKLETQMGTQELQRCITYLDEAAQSNGNRNRWKDWYLMLRRCHENRWHETKYRSGKDEIPKGASGILGEAEMEAIARVMQE